MDRSKRSLTPLYARLLLGPTRPFPNFDMPFIKPVRERAVRSLCLRPGDRVLDAGCGIGAGFSLLARAVGPTGRVVGVEISPETAAAARRRIERNGWGNVEVIAGPADVVALSGGYDALIMFAAPDVYGSKDALANILPHLRSGARVVLFGAKRSELAIGRALNPLLKLALSKLSFATTPHPDNEPWKLVADVVTNLKFEQYCFGTMFLAWGSLPNL